MTDKLKKLFSEFIVGKAVEGKEGVIIEGWANKAVVDDVGDLMKFDNVDLGRYKKNPLLLYNHDRNLPIGRVLEIKVSEAGLWVKAIISNSTDSLVSYIRDLVSEGILKTFSIGFDPKEENFNRAEGYNEISKWRLNEISIVTLPANIDAEFALAKSLGEAKDYQEARAMVLKALEGEKSTEPKVTDTTEPKAICPDCGKDPCECKPSEGGDDGDTEPPNAEDEEAKKKAGFQECIKAKIPKLVEEGKPEEQAVAIAMSMCREDGKCDISYMSSEMFDSAMEIAKGCKKPKKEEPPTNAEDPATKDMGVPPAPATQVNTPDAPSDFGSPHIQIMQSQLAMMGKISTQLETIAKLLEKEEQVGENNNGSNPSLPPVNVEDSAKGLAKLAEIHGRISAMVKDLGV
jgi:HK97 family phage prohead protease